MMHIFLQTRLIFLLNISRGNQKDNETRLLLHAINHAIVTLHDSFQTGQSSGPFLNLFSYIKGKGVKQMVEKEE